jgi:hypothetical protein
MDWTPVQFRTAIIGGHQLEFFVMPRTSLSAPAVRARQFSGGNGTPSTETQGGRLNRIEVVLRGIQQQLDVQFRRIGDLQVQLDRSTASEPKSIR